jgi:hypothetical protein
MAFKSYSVVAPLIGVILGNLLRRALQPEEERRKEGEKGEEEVGVEIKGGEMQGGRCGGGKMRERWGGLQGPR